MIRSLIRGFSSLWLTFSCLVLGCVIVFWGTLAQVQMGLYRAQEEIFRSLFIYWHPAGFPWKIPVFPGGYLIGGLLLINLLVAHVRYYRPGRGKIGIVLVHLGIVLLLAGQMLTDGLSVESVMHLRLGQTRDYSESERQSELAIVDVTDPKVEKVVAIPAQFLGRHPIFQPPGLPFQVRIAAYRANSEVSIQPARGFEPVQATPGFGGDLWWRDKPIETAMDKTDVPSALVDIRTGSGSLGTFFVSEYFDKPQAFAWQGRSYELFLRARRYYLPFSLKLLEFRHDRYPGTDIPKNFSSRVRLECPASGENREVLIYMNNPLRYDGATFYQASFDPDDQGSVLQVVRNPGWLTPYFACALVGVGLIVQFLIHLIPFLKERAAHETSH